MKVGVLGPVEATAGELPRDVGGSRLRQLLAHLAVQAGRPVPAESLCSALWPQESPAARTNALQSLVARLRRALPAQTLLSVPGGYCLALSADDVDCLLFERLARDGRRALRDGEPRRAADLLREALALWRGEPMTGIPLTPSVIAARARLEELRLTAIEDRVEAELSFTAEPSAAVAQLEGLIAAHPLRERLRVLQMKALDSDGRSAEALRAFEDYRVFLAAELGADPGPDLREAHLALLRDPGAERPGGGARRGNLRSALTSFVGREHEREQVRRQLAEGRLVTLVGPGGAGKTRLATTVAADVASAYAGGAWLVDLSAVTTAAEVPHAVISTMGLRNRVLIDAAAMPQRAVDRLVDALSSTQTLIVLDNCEHVIAAAAQLADELLSRCAGVRVLATSREPLAIGGESLCPINPLPLPDRGAGAARALDSPAVRLLAERVRAVRPGFAVTDGNAAAVVEICHRLDGLPLAIELAASRLRSLTVQQLAQRLDDRFRLLTGGGRTAVSRHRTLRAVVAWSWDLLSDEERDLAQWLAVFPSLVTPDSCVRGAAWDAPVPITLLDLLAALVDKSMIQLVEGPQPRYRMLETIREYGIEQVAQAGRLAGLKAEHTARFLALAELAEPRLRGAGQLPWIARLTAELDNLIAALHFALDSGDSASAVRLGAALSHLWAIQGAHAQAAQQLRAALELDGPAPDEAWQAAAAGYLIHVLLSGAAADQRLAERIRTRAADTGLTSRHPMAALLAPALAAAGAGVPVPRTVTEPDADDDKAGGAGPGSEDPWVRGMSLLLGAVSAIGPGDMASVAGALHDAADLFEVAGDRWGLALSLTWLAAARTTLSQYDEAIAALERSLPPLRELDDSDETVLQRVWLAVAKARKGDTERAIAELTDIVAGGADCTSVRYLPFARLSLGDLARQRGDLAAARLHYAAAQDQLRGVPAHAEMFGTMLECALGQLALAEGEPEAARPHLSTALRLAVKTADMPLVAVVGVGVAQLARARDGAHAAAQLLGAAHALRGAQDAGNPDIVSLAERLRGELGEARYQEAYTAGRALERTAALGLIKQRV